MLAADSPAPTAPRSLANAGRIVPISPTARPLLPSASPDEADAPLRSVDAMMADGKARSPARHGSTRSGSVVSATSKAAALQATSKLRSTVMASSRFALKGGLWALLMCIPSIVIILARVPSLESFGRSVATHDPEFKYPPKFMFIAGDAASANADFPPDSYWRATWLAHLDESFQNSVQAFSAFILVVLHITYTHEHAHEREMKRLRRFVFLVCTPAFLLQLFGRTLMFSSIIAQNALIYIPWTIAVVICSKRCKQPLNCPNFAFAVALETFGYMLIGAIYIFILVPIVMVGAPGRQAIILVISLPIIRTMGTTFSRFGSFISTGLAPEHKCVFGLIVPCIAGYTSRLLISSVPGQSARAITVVLTSIINVVMRVQESFREKNLHKYKIMVRSSIDRRTSNLPGIQPEAGGGKAFKPSVDQMEAAGKRSQGLSVLSNEPPMPPNMPSASNILVHQFFVVESEVELASIVLASLTLYVYRLAHDPEQRAATTVGDWALETSLTFLLEIANDVICCAWMQYYEKFDFTQTHLLRSHRITLTFFIMIGVTVVARFTSPYSIWQAKGIEPLVHKGEFFWKWSYD